MLADERWIRDRVTAADDGHVEIVVEAEQDRMEEAVAVADKERAGSFQRRFRRYHRADVGPAKGQRCDFARNVEIAFLDADGDDRGHWLLVFCLIRFLQQKDCHLANLIHRCILTARHRWRSLPLNAFVSKTHSTV